MHDFFLAHNGIDWAAAVFMFLSMWRLGDHKRDGFILAVLASACWIAFNLRVDSAAGVAANAIVLAMAVRSFVTFKKGSGTSHQPSEREPERATDA